MNFSIRPLAPCPPGCVHSPGVTRRAAVLGVRTCDLDPKPAPCDRAFVLGSWVSSYHQRPTFVAAGDWIGMMSLSLNRVISQPGVKVAMAVDLDAAPGDVDLLGWMAYEHHAVDSGYDEQKKMNGYRRVPPGERLRSMEALVWYCFVKNSYRKNGIARRLFDHARIDPGGRFHYVCDTHITAAMRESGKLRRACLRPYLGRPAQERHHGQSQPDSDAAA